MSPASYYKNVRILHVTPYYRDAWAYGGIPRVAAAAAEALVRRGHEVTVATTDACNQRARLPAAYKSVRGGVDVFVFPNLSNRLAARQLFAPVGLDAWLGAEASRFDVAHIHGYRHLPGSIAARRLRTAGVPYILQPNGTAPILERRRLAKRIFDRTLGRGVASGAARLIAVSAAEERQIAALGWDSDRVRHVPNPVELAEFDGMRPRGAHRDSLVVYLGQLTPRKHVDVLVRAVARLRTPGARLRTPGARLAIAGADMGAGAAVDAWTQRLRLQPRVTRVGVLEGTARLAALADADVVAYAGRDEVFGLVAVEALLCGTPVVVADDSGCGEIVSTFGGGVLVPPGDEAALAAALDRILSDPGRWRDAAAGAAAALRGWCGADAVAQALETVYAEVARHAEPAPARPRAVSFVVPVLNGAPHLDDCLRAIEHEAEAIAHEILVVDDGSDDRSPEIAARAAHANPRVRRLDGDRRGAAAAINLGIRAARHPVICQIDQDVVIQPGWLDRMLRALDGCDLAAVQGVYVPRTDAGIWARVAAFDLLDRYERGSAGGTDHVCTGNTAYRAAALHQVGLLDESLGYGYDNDLSYRLGALGYRLGICRSAVATHAWRDGALPYLRQQYGVGYGRLDVVVRHRQRWRGDRVSGAGMIAHAALTLAAVLGVAFASIGAARDSGWQPWLAGATLVLTALAVERAAAGARVAHRFRDRAGWCFAPVHVLRDLAWTAAIVVWSARRLAGRIPRASHSMARGARTERAGVPLPPDAADRVVVVIPAYNEAQNLPHVLDELRRVYPAARPVVVDDGSTDETPDVLAAVGVEHLRLAVRLGVGGAVKAGLRHARSLEAACVVRMDGDGQHRPEDVARLMTPILSGDADVAVGTRYVKGAPGPGPARRLLAATLSALTHSRVTDPTSGLWAFGPRAVQLLAQHHPTGYAEPELRLLMARNGLRVSEVPIAIRVRRAGRTSITAARAGVALARTLLALVIVPLRATLARDD